MPVSEHEELGVNLSRHTSDSVAGVPIKKRRFPLVSSPSPPPRILYALKGEPDLPNKQQIQSPSKTLSSPKGEPDLPNKEQSIRKPEPFSSNVGGQRDVSAVSVITKASLSEDKGECFADKSASSGKRTENQIGFNLQGSLLPRTTGAVDEISSDQVVSENTELLLASKETCQNAEGSSPVQENIDSYSQALRENCSSNHHGLAKAPGSAEGQNNVQKKGTSGEPKVGCTRLCANRSLWDLNTMMDTWEGPLNDAAINHGTSGTDGSCPNGMCDKKPEICSVGMTSREPEHTAVPLEKHILGASDLSLPAKLRSAAGSLKSDDDKSVKSKSFEVGSQEESKTVKLANPKSLDCEAVKFEPFERSGQEVLKIECKSVKWKPFGGSAQEVVKIECKAVKSEPFGGSAQEVVQKTVEGTSCRLEFFSTHDTPICRAVPLIQSGGVSKASNLVSESVVPDGVESVAVTDMLLEAVEISCMDSANPKPSKSISMDELRADPYDDKEAVESDEEEKINLSADLGEDAYGSDSDSDGCRNAVGVMDTLVEQQEDEDDYEDGEVREELLVRSVIDGMCDEEVEHLDYGDSDNKEGDDCNGPVDDHVLISSHAEARNSRSGNSIETNNPYCIGEHDSNEKNCQGLSAMPSLQEPSVSMLPNVRSGKQLLVKAVGRVPRDHSKGTGKELESDTAVSASQEIFSKDSQSDAVNQRENAKGSKLGEESHLISPHTEAYLNGDEANIDVNGRDSQSRIINLVRAPNGSPPGRTRSIPGRPPLLRIDRERLSDSSVRGDKLHPRVSRGENGMDDFRKFEKEWNQDQPPKNSRPDFMHGRGRADNRMDTSRAIWDSDRDYASEHHNGSPSFRFPRAKNAAAIAAAKLESSGFVVAPDGTILGASRAGRKPTNDEMQNFRHPLSRRRSPGGREGPMPSPGVQMVCKPVRDVSPGLVRRHEEKFMRGLPDEMMDPFFSHPQPQYERVENNSFGRRERINRKYSPIQRRRDSLHFSRIQSKSPPRSRTRSPRPWSSPRRSPGGFNGRSGQMRGRSPPMFRVERVRSPHHLCFQENMMGRRHGSPPFIPRIPEGMREIDSPRERNHPRPFIPNRSPSGRILRRDPKRFDLMNGRERTDEDGYFGPLHSGQFRELSSDRIVDERRKFSGRRGPFRPYDIGAPHLHVEDDSRPYRFSPEADEEFPVRSGSRDFDGRIKNRPGRGNTLRRPRSMERQEDNYRFGGQGWSDTGFNDVRLRRRKF